MAAMDNWYRGALAAWEMLIDFPLPTALHKKTAGRKGVSAAAKLAGFPLTGAAVGLALALVGRFCVTVFNPAAGAMVFAIVALLVLELKDSGRSLGLMISLLMLKARGLSWNDACNRMNPDLNAITSPLAAAGLALLEILKAAMLFLICFGHACSWPVVMLAGAFAVQGALAGLPELGSGKPLLAVAADQRRVLGWVVGVICILWMIFFPFAAFAAGLAVWLMAAGFSRYFERTFGGVSAEMITLAGSIAEFLLLLIGVLFAVTV